MRVQDIMTKEPSCCTPEDGLRTVAQMMDDCDCGAIPIVESKETRRPIGVITDRDIVIRVVAKGEMYQNVTAGQAMTTSLVTITGDEDIEEAERVMKEKQIRRLIVIDDEGRCDGILSQADLARHTPDSSTGDVVEEISEPNVPVVQ